MAVILRYFTESVAEFMHESIVFCSRARCRRKESSRSLSRLLMSFLLYHTKDHLAWFFEKKNGLWGRPLLPEILGQPAPVGAKSPILNRYSLV